MTFPGGVPERRVEEIHVSFTPEEARALFFSRPPRGEPHREHIRATLKIQESAGEALIEQKKGADV